MAVNPIDKGMRERLAGARRRMRDVIQLLQSCKACGMDVAEREQAAAFLFDKLNAIQETFGGVKEERAINCKPISERRLPDGSVEVTEQCDDGTTRTKRYVKDATGKYSLEGSGPDIVNPSGSAQMRRT